MVKKVIFIFMQKVRSISLTSLSVTNGNSSCLYESDLIGEGYLNDTPSSVYVKNVCS